jgi:Delta3,5-Delta2,4-dienoyl-CoA isomerase
VVDGGRDAVVRETLKLAEVIASKSPVAVATTKTYLLHARDHTFVTSSFLYHSCGTEPKHRVADALDYTATWNAAMLQAKVLLFRLHRGGDG